MSPYFYKIFEAFPEAWKVFARRWWQWLMVRLRLRSVAPMAAGLSLVFLIHAGLSGKLLTQPALWFLPAPLFLYGFLKTADPKNREVYRDASRREMVVGASGFVLALFVADFAQVAALAIAVAGSMFIFLDPQPLRRLASQHRNRAIAAVVGGLSGMGHYAMQMVGAKWIATATVKMVRFSLHSFINRMQVFEKGHRVTLPPPHRFHYQVPVRIFPKMMPDKLPVPDVPKAPVPEIPFDFMAVASDHFILRVFVFQNVGVGVFLFVMLLSLELLLSGQKVKPWTLAAMVMGGIAAIFAINLVLMTLYFAIGDAAQTPGANGLVSTLFSMLSYFISSPLWGMVGYMVVAVALIKCCFTKAAVLKNFRCSVA